MSNSKNNIEVNTLHLPNKKIGDLNVFYRIFSGYLFFVASLGFEAANFAENDPDSISYNFASQNFKDFFGASGFFIDALCSLSSHADSIMSKRKYKNMHFLKLSISCFALVSLIYFINLIQDYFIDRVNTNIFYKIALIIACSMIAMVLKIIFKSIAKSLVNKCKGADEESSNEGLSIALVIKYFVFAFIIPSTLLYIKLLIEKYNILSDRSFFKAFISFLFLFFSFSIFFELILYELALNQLFESAYKKFTSYLPYFDKNKELYRVFILMALGSLSLTALFFIEKYFQLEEVTLKSFNVLHKVFVFNLIKEILGLVFSVLVIYTGAYMGGAVIDLIQSKALLVANDEKIVANDEKILNEHKNSAYKYLFFNVLFGAISSVLSTLYFFDILCTMTNIDLGYSFVNNVPLPILAHSLILFVFCSISISFMTYFTNQLELNLIDYSNKNQTIDQKDSSVFMNFLSTSLVGDRIQILPTSA